MSIQWSAGKIHRLAKHNWGYIRKFKVLHELKESLEYIMAIPEFIHNQDFMTGVMTTWVEELPPFKECLKNLLKKGGTSATSTLRKRRRLCFSKTNKRLLAVGPRE